MKIFTKLFYLSTLLLLIYTIILFIIGSYEIDYFDGTLRILSRVYISKGLIPYKDFSVVYPPGMFFVFGKIFPYISNEIINLHIGGFYLLFYLFTSLLIYLVGHESHNIGLSLSLITIYFSLIIRIFGHSDAFSIIFPVVAVLLYILNSPDRNKYFYLINFLTFAGSVWFRWEWMFMLLIFEVSIEFILNVIKKYKFIRLKRKSLATYRSSIIKITLSSALGYLSGWFSLMYYFNIYNVAERAIDFIIKIPITLTSSFRDLPLPTPKHPLKPEMLFYLSLVYIIVLLSKTFFYFKKQKQNINVEELSKIVLALSVLLIFIVYALGRSDWPHFIPLWFYLGIIWVVINLKLRLFDDKILLLILIPVLPLGGWYIKSSKILIPRNNFAMFQMNDQISECKNMVYKVGSGSIFVGRISYERYLWNNASLYLTRTDLKPATSFITEEPGIHNSCKYGLMIYNELVISNKPMIAFLNMNLQDGENKTTKNMSSCGYIEKYLNENSFEILGKCRSVDSEFEVRLYK